MRRQLSARTIAVARRLFKDTPVQRWRVTDWAFREVFGWGNPGTELVATVPGAELVVPAAAVSLASALLSGTYEVTGLELFTRLAAVSTVVVDVGGNIGVYACAAAAHLPTGGQVITFEPAPDNLVYLERNLARNGLADRVVVVAAAVGAEAGQMALHLSRDHGLHSASAANLDQPGRILSVPVVTLDDHLDEHGLDMVDLLKIDIQGFDGYALRGARRTIARCQPTLLVEFEPVALANCGFDPSAFVHLVCDAYPHVFVASIHGKGLRRCDRTELLAIAAGSRALNLVAVSRADHLALVEPSQSLLA
jgi:FkbM family methyltransferase